MELAEKIRLVQQGDKAALNDIVRTYGGSVFQRALRKTGNRELAQKITQGMVSELVETLNSYPGADGYDLWLWTLANKHLKSAEPMGELTEKTERSSEVPVYTSAPLAERTQQAAPPAAMDRAPEPFGSQPYRTQSEAWAAPYAQVSRTERLPNRSEELERMYGLPAEPENADMPGNDPGNLPARPARKKGNRQRAQVSLEEFEKPRFWSVVGVLLLIIVCLVLCWFAVGLMMRLGYLPALDFGYVWFNEHIYLLF